LFSDRNSYHEERVFSPNMVFVRGTVELIDLVKNLVDKMDNEFDKKK
jgi:hypothetical protein